MQLSNFRIQQKLIGLVAILALGILATSSLAFYFSYQDTLAGKKDQIRSVVQATSSQVIALRSEKAAGNISENVYNNRLRNLINDVSYGHSGYIYLMTQDLRVHLHPKRPELEGFLISELPSLSHPQMMIDGFKQVISSPSGSHFWELYWPKPSGGPSVAKLTYAELIPESNLILGTGIYIDDLVPLYIQRAFSYLIITIVVLCAALLTAALISRNIVRPIASLSKQMNDVAHDDIDQEILYTEQQDEIGSMARALEHFREHLIENKRLRYMQEHVQFLENFDPVTRLYNRRAMGEALEREVIRNFESQEHVYFLFIRLDLLRNLTIELGDEQRDQILIETANRLRQRLSVNHSLGRLSEGCFGLMIIDKPDDVDLDSLTTELLHTLEQPIQLDSIQIQIAARIGITSFPEDGDQQFELIGRAEIAAKTAKKREQGWLYFNQIRDTQVKQKMELWQDLSIAMEQDQFYLVFQPLFDLESNTPLSAETLLRWTHPEHGPISPATFVPLAEQSGLISRLDHWVLNAVARQCRLWLDNELTLPRIAINLSGISFLRNDFEQRLTNTFKAHNVPLHHIELELTEGVLIEDLARIQEKLQRVRDMGISVSIDDFGTGYSSLSRIKNLPVDHIKIDKSFIDDIDKNPQDLKIVQAIILMAQGLQLKVVAEGVETEKQLSILREEHCDVVQGYLLSRPLSVEDFESLIDEDLIIEGA
ncbi:EAL domain-containing protein [Neptuniibacter caesariensis]|uniref:Two-component response regulator n=1 Tax=Neptuniibacter caesariensis TaxID=207954 RepID=A0A7U8C9Z4_NEPCE|nr:EAL domain-containing protein [Neptuniibacter caesariensis]EAR62889.1 two-component response regulator [Oceanospirillum sp. MED92] [Neptuniibacter caesariensis]